MVYTIKNNKGKIVNNNGTRNAFATKREAKIVKAYLRLKHPRMKIKIVKIR